MLFDEEGYSFACQHLVLKKNNFKRYFWLQGEEGAIVENTLGKMKEFQNGLIMQRFLSSLEVG